MRTLPEEIDELHSRAKYMEEKHSAIPATPDYWTRLQSVCDQARLVCPKLLTNLVPDESQRTWAEVSLCLVAVNEALRNSTTLG
jgi:hypothetical protein